MDEKIIQTGLLQGAEKEIIFEGVRAMADELQIRYDLYLSLKAVLHENVGAHKAGIITNVATLELEVTAANLFTVMTRIIMQVCRIHMEADDWYSPQYTLRQVTKEISNIRDDKHWSYRNILKRIKYNFDERLMEFPDFDQGAEKIAIHLQERIRRIVLKLIEQEFDSLKEPNFKHHPECQFLQYILPCFVAFFLDLDKDPSASVESKRKYLDFVHEMIKSYEQTEFTHEKIFPEMTLPYACASSYAFQDLNLLQKRCAFVEENLREILCNGKTFDRFVSKGLSSKFLADSIDLSAERLNFAATRWPYLVFMFNSRMRAVFRKMGFCDNPEVISQEIKNVFLAPHELGENIQITKACKNYAVREEVALEIIQTAQNQGLFNLYGYLLFELVVINMHYSEREEEKSEFDDIIQGPGFPLDPVDSALWALRCSDFWKFKMVVSTIFPTRKGNEDPTLISYHEAKCNRLYRRILKVNTPEGIVPFDKPGDMTFIQSIYIGIYKF